jgi:hypothetical protein
MSPHKAYYNACLNDWMLSNPGKPVTINNVSGIIGRSFGTASTKCSTEVGFNVTGIHSLNENAFCGESEKKSRKKLGF